MILAIIQARLSSERLPGKVLKDIAGKPMLEWVIDAAEGSELIDEVVVATSTMASDLKVCDYCADREIDYSTGPLNDVLERFYLTATAYAPVHVVRLTGDCPLLTGEIIDVTIRHYLGEGLDYILNAVDGVDVEVFPYTELLRAQKLATDPADREHVTPFIKRYAGLMGDSIKVGRNDVPRLFSVDTEEELAEMRGVLEGCMSNRKSYLTVL